MGHIIWRVGWAGVLAEIFRPFGGHVWEGCRHVAHSPRSDGVVRWGSLIDQGEPLKAGPLFQTEGQSCVFTEEKGVEEASSPFPHLPNLAYSFLVPSSGLSHS